MQNILRFDGLDQNLLHLTVTRPKSLASITPDNGDE